MTVGKSDPNYGPALEAVQKALGAASELPPELAALQSSLVEDAEESKQVTDWLVSGVALVKKMSKGAKRLSDGLQKLEGAGKKLAHGSARLARAASGLQDGVARLGAGATALASGIGQLRRRRDGAGRKPRPRLRRVLSAAVGPAPRDRAGALQLRFAEAPGAPRAAGDAGDLRLRLLCPLGARRRPAADPRAGGGSGRPERRRPGGGDPRDLPLHLQLAGLDRAQQAARQGGRRARARSRAGDRRRRRPGAAQRLQPRHPRADPLRRSRRSPWRRSSSSSSSCGRCRWRRSRWGSTWRRSRSPSAS